MAKVGKRTLKATPTHQIEGKLQPQALELEQAVLGALMIDNESLSDAIDSLQAEYFYKAEHQRIFESIVKKPLNLSPPKSSATKPNGPFGPFVTTIHIFSMFVSKQLKISAVAGTESGGIKNGSSKPPITHAWGIFFKISVYLFCTYLYSVSVSNVASSGT